MSKYYIDICEKITNRLDKLGKDRVAPRTILSASPKVIKHFKDDEKKLYDWIDGYDAIFVDEFFMIKNNITLN